MNYNQVDAAISFLYTDENDLIVIQVPYHKDIRLVKDYIIKKYGYPTENGPYELIFHNKKVCFESISSGWAGIAYRFEQLFFIDRGKDRSYYRNLEVISQ